MADYVSKYTGAQIDEAVRKSLEGGASAPWLVGTTADITPAQVVEALQSEQDVLLTHTNAAFGTNSFTGFVISEGLAQVMTSGLISYNGILLGAILAGSIETGEWSLRTWEMAYRDLIPAFLPSPGTLTFTGAAEESYNGAGDVTINIPAGLTADDKAAIALDVLALIDASAAAQVVVDEDKNITLSGDLADGAYTLKYLNADGSTTDICTLTIADGSGEGSGGSDDSGGDDSGETDDPVVTTGNLFVASTCTLNKRINSSGVLADQDQTFVTDYINIGDCMADGGTNQIHFRGFFMYYHSMTDGEINIGDFYRTVNYYDDNNTFLGQAGYYVDDFVADANGDGLITLDASMTTATKIRICGAIASADLTSTDQLADCKITLNELISD